MAKETKDGKIGFLWDGDILLAEERSSKSNEYIFEPGGFAPLCRFDGEGFEAYHNDHLGTPRELTDERGEIIWSARYDVYGRANQLQVDRTENQIRFQGQYEDVETGLYYNRFRYFAPDIGRYSTQDSIGLGGGVNLYSYVRNLVNWVDPLGLKCTRIVKEGNRTILEIHNKFPRGSRESRQLQRFTKAWNEEIAQNGGSMVRRGPLSKAEQAASDKWKEEMRRRFPARFDGKVVAHTPDAIMGGPPANGRALALDTSVNSYLGGAAGGVAEGTKYHAVRLYR